jgi:IclR family transcriptional regulator, KDG regulon repressor
MCPERARRSSWTGHITGLSAMPYTISAVDRALSLLETLAEHPGLGVTEIAALTGNTKSLVFRLIYTLEQRGYVIKDPAKRTYTLGYRPIYLAANAHDQIALLRLADPILDGLASRSQETVNLLVRDGKQSVCLAVRPSSQSVRLYAQVGRRGPLHVGGGPKILLAAAPDEVIDEVLGAPLERYTDATITDPVKLRALLATIHRNGCNESFGDLDAEAFSFAAGVLNAQGEVVASVSIAGLRNSLTDERIELFRRSVRDAARRISEVNGYRPRLVAAM